MKSEVISRVMEKKNLDALLVTKPTSKESFKNYCLEVNFLSTMDPKNNHHMEQRVE